MLLTTAVLVLRETLEATVVVSVLLAWSVLHRRSRGWAWWAFGAGIAGSALYAAQVDVVSEWFDFAGMEVVNAGMHVLICAMLSVLAWRPTAHPAPTSPMLVVVALAVVREGFEILLYLSGFAADHRAWGTVLLGSVLGAGIGVSIGALLFYLAVGMPRERALWFARVLIALFAGNMAAQAVLLLIQADWISTGAPLWNTSHLLAEDSIVGQLLYALIGYEATPSVWQVVAYGATFCLMLWPFFGRPLRKHSSDGGS
ncbi:MAG: FTR1 family protein [Pseudomonadales bacterium]|jgi:high-affinity iron transporter|nr:FTR1 family protein [Pseudomonadales bacterium]MCP5337483.1 FTR1 family protein [Pseudomonadales bacterium]